MPTCGKIVDLRNLLAERFPHPPISLSTRLTTGLSSLDSILPGGLPQGAITELISPPVSGGSASLISSLVLTRRSMVSSAQFKIVLENAWTLQAFDQENPLSGLRMRMQRSHIYETGMAIVEVS